MYCRSFRVPTKAGMCLLLRNIFRKSERRYYCIFRHRNVNQRRESWLSIADEIIKHHVITTEYGIYELSVSLSKVPDRKFFCRREQWIKRQGRGRKGKIYFTGGTLVARGKGFLLTLTSMWTYTHVEAPIHIYWISTTWKQKRREYNQWSQYFPGAPEIYIYV